MALNLDFGGVKLGHRVRDVTTGIEGYAVQLCWGLAGWRQVTIQPSSADEKDYKAPIGVDYQMVEVVGDGIVDKAIQPRRDIVNLLGKIASDTVTGAKGTVTEMISHVNGCVTCYIQPKKGPLQSELPTLIHLDHKRLKVEKDGPLAESARSLDAVDTVVPVGPSVRVVSRRPV